jgi:hypothetical protein
MANTSAISTRPSATHATTRRVRAHYFDRREEVEDGDGDGDGDGGGTGLRGVRARVPEAYDEHYGEGANELRQCAPELGEEDLPSPMACTTGQVLVVGQLLRHLSSLSLLLFSLLAFFFVAL